MAWTPRPKRLAATLIALGAWAGAAPAFASIVVTNTNDSGKGSLRNAILEANAAPGPESITFKIYGTPPHVISPLSQLPLVTNTVAIIGTGTPKRLDIVLDGSRVPAHWACALDLQGTGSRVQSLVINGWPRCGILLGGGGGHKIDGNRIGTDAFGRRAVGNNRGLEVGSSDNQIGVNAPNVVSGNDWIDLWLRGGSRNHIQGNFIGPDASGQHLGGEIAIVIERGMRNTVTTNVIVGGIFGILLGETSSNVIVANTISVTTAVPKDPDVYPQVPFGFGVVFADSGDNVLGSTVPGAGNTIAMAHVGATGVAVMGNSVGNAIRGNRIHDLGIGCPDDLYNVHPNNPCLAIDLGPLGPTPNDPQDADSGPNNLQNAPRLLDALVNGLGTQVVGELEARPSSSYVVDLYLSPVNTGSGSCEARSYLGSTSITTDVTGRAIFFLTSPTQVPQGHFVGATATVTPLVGYWDTSEVSPCRIVRGQ